MASMDIFKSDAFSLQSLTKAINDTLPVPGRLGELGLFSEESISTTNISMEMKGTSLAIVQNMPRGAPANPVQNDKRRMVNLSANHLPQRGAVLADEVQNLRAFGSETEVESVQTLINQKLAKMRRNIDVTMEWQRVGALKGQVLDADGTTVLQDMYTTFGVSQQTMSMVLGSDVTKVRTKAIQAKRTIEQTLSGLPYRGLRALCSPTFFDALNSHPAIEAAYNRWLDGQYLRTDTRAGFEFAGVIWEEYNGYVGATNFIEANTAYLIPEGVPDMFVTYYAPADYTDTVNTMGLPYYAMMEAMDFNKGYQIETQSNPLCVNTKPSAVLKLTV